MALCPPHRAMTAIGALTATVPTGRSGHLGAGPPAQAPLHTRRASNLGLGFKPGLGLYPPAGQMKRAQVQRVPEHAEHRGAAGRAWSAVEQASGPGLGHHTLGVGPDCLWEATWGRGQPLPWLEHCCSLLPRVAAGPPAHLYLDPRGLALGNLLPEAVGSPDWAMSSQWSPFPGANRKTQWPQDKGTQHHVPTQPQVLADRRGQCEVLRACMPSNRGPVSMVQIWVLPGTTPRATPGTSHLVYKPGLSK